MSKKAVEEFLASVDESGELRDLVRKALQGKDDQAPVMVEVAETRGFEFTTDEYAEVIEVLSRRSERELSEDELEVVSGGSRPVDPPGPTTRIQFKNFRLNLGVFS